MLFLAGYTFVSYPVLLDRCQALWPVALLSGLLCSGLLFAVFFDFTGASFTPLQNGQQVTDVTVLNYLGFCVLRMLNAWSWLIACVGLAGRFLQRPGVLLSYLTQAVYPLFCLHLTLSVVLSYIVVPLPWASATKYLFITTGTIALALMIYDLLIKRSTWLRPLFGLKPIC